MRDRTPTRASTEKPRDAEFSLSDSTTCLEVSTVCASQTDLCSTTYSVNYSELADTNLSASMHSSVNDIDSILDQHECETVKSVNSELKDDKSPLESTDFDKEFDITKLDIEDIHISKNDKFHKWLAITKCDKCWNRYAFYEIDYSKGPWALYCPSPDHRWSEYVCSDCFPKTQHFRKHCKMRVVRFVRDK